MTIEDEMERLIQREFESANATLEKMIREGNVSTKEVESYRKAAQDKLNEMVKEYSNVMKRTAKPFIIRKETSARPFDPLEFDVLCADDTTVKEKEGKNNG